MLLMRPGAAVLILYCSGILILSFFRYGESGGNNGITTPPCTMGWGAYGASVCVPGLGTLIGAGIGGNGACGTVASCAAALPTRKASAAIVRFISTNISLGRRPKAWRPLSAFSCQLSAGAIES